MSDIIVRQIDAFTKRLKHLDCEAQFSKLLEHLGEHPEAGALIQGTNGLRKVRIALPGRGKRGGARIIYHWLKEHRALIFLWIYAKGESENISASGKKALAAMLTQIKVEYQNEKRKKGR